MLRMDVSQGFSSSWRWIIVFLRLCSLAHSRLAHLSGGPGSIVHRSPVQAPGHGYTYGRLAVPLPGQQFQQSPELSARPRTVSVRCHPDSMEVVVQADLFDTGLEVDGAHLRLGPDPAPEHGACRAVQTGRTEFTIRTLLLDCGSKLSSTKDKIIYSTVLVFSPEPSPDGLHRLDEATIPVECHYEKRYSVGGAALQPAWDPLGSIISADDHMEFSLRVMTSDWQYERASYSYFLGETIHLEVSALVGNHQPLRVYVDHCVATATPDTEATVKYDFIEREGCLTDAFLTDSKSHFLPRAEQHKLRLQLDAFRFHQEPQNQIFITCFVRAVPVTLAAGSSNRACSFIENRWRSVDGNDEICANCSTPQRPAGAPQTHAPKSVAAPQTQSNVNSVASSTQNRNEHSPATFLRVQPGWQQGRGQTPAHHQRHHQSHAGVMKRGTGQEAGKMEQLGPFTISTK